MSCSAILYNDKKDPMVKELVDALGQTGLDSYIHIYSLREIKPLLSPDFQGFIILACPVEQLRKDRKLIQEKMNHWFLIYYYNTFISEDLQKFTSLNFDFIIAGNQRRKNLTKVLKFLKSNCWKKIPLPLLNLEHQCNSPLLRKILLFIEVSTTDPLDVEYMADHLNVEEDQIRTEIHETTHMKCTDFFNKIEQFYRKRQKKFHI